MTAGANQTTRPPKPVAPPFVGLPNLAALRELQDQPQWLAWDYAWKEDKQKWDKPPIDAKTGYSGSSTDPATWGSYARVAQHVERNHLAGVGYALTKDEERSGIDLDKCRNRETGALQSWAQIVVDFAETYTEVSPSGEGLRLFVRGKTETVKNDAAHVEIYPDGRYLTITGLHVEGTPEDIREAPKTLAYLRERAEQFKEAERAAAERVREMERKKAERQAAAQAEREAAGGPSISERAAASARQLGKTSGGMDDGKQFWREVNTRALANLSSWVPMIFPRAKPTSDGGFRLSSRDLGRDYEEDMSFHPTGIVDFGVHDMGDARDGKLTPIQVAIDHGSVGGPAEAALWLCDRIGINPESIGWRSGQRTDAGKADAHPGDAFNQARGEQPQQPQEPPAPAFEARPFEWINPSKIPPREWLLERHLIRRFISVTAAPGGVGKSSLILSDALALATGRNLIGNQPHGQFNVLMWNGEDPLEEMQRRIMAACLQYEIEEQELKGRLFVNSGRDDPIIVAEQKRDGVMIAVPVVEAIKATIRKNKIDVVLIDPFVSCHAVNENDNGAIDRVAKLWAKIAHDTGCAIELVHHTRKTGGNETVMEDMRGAVALLSAARSGRILNIMSAEQAEAAGVEERRLHFRVDNGKANLAPPPTGRSTWFKMTSVPLMNGGSLGSIQLDGDSVGVVTAWEWPDPFDDLGVGDLLAAQKEVAGGSAAGARWRMNVQANDWVGKPIASALRLDPDNKAHRQRIGKLLKKWIETGMFVLVEGYDENRKLRPFVEVGTWATAS